MPILLITKARMGPLFGSGFHTPRSVPCLASGMIPLYVAFRSLCSIQCSLLFWSMYRYIPIIFKYVELSHSKASLISFACFCCAILLFGCQERCYGDPKPHTFPVTPGAVWSRAQLKQQNITQMRMRLKNPHSSVFTSGHLCSDNVHIYI